MSVTASVIQHWKGQGKHKAEHLFTYIVTASLSKPALATPGNSMQVQGNGGFLKKGSTNHNRCTADDKCCGLVRCGVRRTVSELAEY
jgi:hypothetical protein